MSNKVSDGDDEAMQLLYADALQHQPKCCHYQDLVRVGKHHLHVGGVMHMQQGDAQGYDLLVPLLDNGMPFEFRGRYSVLALPLRDYGGVPKGWKKAVQEVIQELEAGKRILAFCMGGHGRTGTLLASLIALLENRIETPDPIAAVRERYCSHAVETLDQAIAVFLIRGQALPPKYYTMRKAHRVKTQVAVNLALDTIGKTKK